jgi:GNAT superfamily N-acetyltransferase
MNKFILSVGPQEVATGVSKLINQGGQFGYQLTPTGITKNPISYMIELDGGKIIGVIGLERVHPKVTELKHLSVDPGYRRKGIGKRLLEKAIKYSPTEFIYGMVRADNATNIRNNLRVGMTPIGKKRGRHGYLICFARRTNGTNAQQQQH